MRKDAVLAAMRLQRAATLGLLTTLAAEDWDRVTASGVSVRDIVTRLIALDEGLARGRFVLVARRVRALDDLTRWCDARSIRYRGRLPEELLNALASSGERMAAVGGHLPAFVWRIRCRSPLGSQPLLHLLCRLVLTDWAAEQDIRDRFSDDTEPVDAVRARALSVAVEATLPAVVLPRVERSAGVLRVVVETGSESRRVFGVDFARKQYGPRITAPPDAIVRLDVATFARTALGRATWRAAPHGTVRQEGDERLATAFLDALEGSG